MTFIDKPAGCFCDRKEKEPELEGVDVIMMTLDAEHFLEKCLYTVYREIPVRRLLVCDGGSRDNTLEILKNFPRVEIFVRPDIRTTSKTLEFLISLTETKWFLMIDSDIELSTGWYDEMCKHKHEYDVLENSKVIFAYHKYVQENDILNPNSRSSNLCHLVQKEAIRNFQCDDDYMWRYTDILLRQAVEKYGHKYGKISTTGYVHNETERIPYASDSEKSYQKIVMREPERIIINKEKAKVKTIQNAKAVVKYLDPNSSIVKTIHPGFDTLISLLDRKWVEENGYAWLKRYDRTHSINFKIKYFLYRHIISKSKTLETLIKKISPDYSL